MPNTWMMAVAVVTLSALAGAVLTAPRLAAGPASQDGLTDAADKAVDGDTLKALDYTMKSLDGKDKKLTDYKGKVVLIVNVASKCGLTPQYKDLQALHEKYAKRGLAILAFPCNQFGGQEPGSSEQIAQFCSDEYGVEFDLFAKIDVNGEDRCALYKYLTALDVEPKGKGDITWNFEKFLLDRDGLVIGRYHPRLSPSDKSFVRAVESALGAGSLDQ